jgi:hypothetical protein
MLAAVLASAATGTSNRRAVVIPFEKDCPVFTCTETPGSALDIETTLTPVDLEAGLFHYTAVETITSSQGSFTMSLVGVLDLNSEPNETLVKGYVIRGTWDGRNLAGASVRAKAHRVTPGQGVFAGWVKITPSR